MVKEKFVKQHGNDALKDSKKRVQFGLEWCGDGKFKFVYGGLDNSVSDFFYYRVSSNDAWLF